jgi:hypothetical protein
LEVDGRLPKGLIPGEDDLPGSVAVACFEADPFSGGRIDAIEAVPAFSAGDEAIASFHGALRFG